MAYTPLFDAAALETQRGARPGTVSYVYFGDLELAVNVALAAHRPLLLSGSPGTGKSTLAADVAWKLGRRFYTQTITSRTTAEDLQWSYDSVRRLSIAAAGKELPPARDFVTPGALWRAFHPASATVHGAPSDTENGRDAVVLIDEIDKAEPDVPNDLLVVLDRREFTVRETGETITADNEVQSLFVITTNGERDLPPAFLRRCVCHEIQFPKLAADREQLLKLIAVRHVPRTSAALIDQVYGLYAKLCDVAASQTLREPSTAELVDALRACDSLQIRDAADPKWEEVATAALWKHPMKLAVDPGGPQ
jgi:MoxR-like ATPase